MAADNDGCIIENEALSQANKILFEQCKDEKGKLNDGYSELQDALDQRFEEGIQKEKGAFDIYLTNERSKLEKMIKTRGEILNSEKYAIFLDTSAQSSLIYTEGK